MLLQGKWTGTFGYEGVTALWAASDMGNMRACEYLLSLKANSRFQPQSSSDQKTCIFRACEQSQWDICRRLLYAGADPMVPDKVRFMLSDSQCMKCCANNAATTWFLFSQARSHTFILILLTLLFSSFVAWYCAFDSNSG